RRLLHPSHRSLDRPRDTRHGPEYRQLRDARDPAARARRRLLDRAGDLHPRRDRGAQRDQHVRRRHGPHRYDAGAAGGYAGAALMSAARDEAMDGYGPADGTGAGQPSARALQALYFYGVGRARTWRGGRISADEGQVQRVRYRDLEALVSPTTYDLPPF